MKVEKRIHPVYIEWLQVRHLMTIHKLKPFVGEFQYFYTSPKGQISLIELPDHFGDGKDLWEICGGELTGSTERFKSKEEAEVRIRELLD